MALGLLGDDIYRSDKIINAEKRKGYEDTAHKEKERNTLDFI